MGADYEEEWLGWAQRLYQRAEEDEERRWMNTTLSLFCWEISGTPYAEECQAGENRLVNAGIERCLQLWKRDGSAPKKCGCMSDHTLTFGST